MKLASPLFRDDPRVEWLPDDPDAVEAHVRIDGTCDLVVGYHGGRFGELDAFVRRCAGDRAEIWARFTDATGANVLDAGAQLAADHARLQVYLRGHYGPDAVARAFAAVGCEAHRQLVANALALFQLQSAEMIGLELEGDRIGAAIYLAVPNRGPADVAAIADAIGFVVAALRPASDAAAQWRLVAAELLATASEEFIYVSFEPTSELRWIKIDVGPRPLALGGVIAQRLGLDPSALLATGAAHDMRLLTHLGLRFGGASPAVSIYHALR